MILCSSLRGTFQVFGSVTKQCNPYPRARSPSNRITHALRHLDAIVAHHLHRKMVFFIVSHHWSITVPLYGSYLFHFFSMRDLFHSHLESSVLTSFLWRSNIFEGFSISTRNHDRRSYDKVGLAMAKAGVIQWKVFSV